MFRLIAVTLLLIAFTCFGRGDATSCHAKYTQAAFNHSRCINVSESITQLPPTAAQITEIVTEHNRIRAAVNAANMVKMVWNADIALSAQQRAATCVFAHEKNSERREPGKFPVGQNIALKLGMQNYAEMISEWEDEKPLFNANRTYSSAAGHYSAGPITVPVSQGTFGGHGEVHLDKIVWAETSMVGCGRAKCPFYYPPHDKTYYVDHVFCNYAPAGNLPDVEAYSIDGGVCSQCGSANCDNNLCDCGSSNAINGCYNMGTLNLQTCQCSCRIPAIHTGTLCELETCPTSDPTSSNCDAQAQYKCDLYSNMPIDCPVKCNTCPYATQ